MIVIILLKHHHHHHKYFIYTAKDRSAEYKNKTAGINLFAVIKYFKIKKKKAERLIFTIKKVLKN